MAKIFKLLVNIIFVIIIVLLSIYVLLRMTDKIEIYQVKTGSMEEKIHVGDYILIYQKDDYNVGDIVTYTSNEGFITHRIVRKNGSKIITKGDANNSEDKEIIASTIVGETILIGGILNIIINYKYVIVCILISLYLFSCYFDHNGEEKKRDEAEEKKDETKEYSQDKKTEEQNENSLKDKVGNMEETKIAKSVEIEEKIKDVEENKIEKEDSKKEK